MGDLATHELVGAAVVEMLTAAGARESFTHLLLGNFMTDVSQFRDPTAFVSAKSSAAAIRVVSGLSVTRSWADDLFGTPAPDRRNGALAAFLRELARFLAHVYFNDEKLTSKKLISTDLLPAAEVDRVFAQRFTQYFPHEHVDLDPLADGPEQATHPLYQVGPGGMPKYLSEQIDWIAEELRDLQQRWAGLRGADAADRVDLMAQLGHLNHAVEDFFFHSSVCELWTWHRLLAALRDERPTPGEPPLDPLGVPLALALGAGPSVNSPDSVHLRRQFVRRLRRPVYDGRVLDRARSDLATEAVFTGGFGSTDVFHTVGAALEAMERRVEDVEVGGLPGAADVGRTELRNTSLALFRMIFNRAERVRAAGESGHADRLADLHRSQLTDPNLAPVLQRDLDAVQVACGPSAAGALKAMLDVDRAFIAVHDRLPSVGGFVILLLARTEAERRASRERQQVLDSEPASVAGTGSANGASAENIGTHSLMSKDSTAKEPMRTEAIRGAVYASGTVAGFMAVPPPGTPAVLDWRAVLRYLLRFPPQDGTGWEDLVLAGAEPAEFTERPPRRPAAPPLRRRSLRTVLEARYQGLEAVMQRRVKPGLDD